MFSLMTVSFVVLIFFVFNFNVAPSVQTAVIAGDVEILVEKFFPVKIFTLEQGPSIL